MQPSIFSAYDPLHSPPELQDIGLLGPEMAMWSDIQLMNTMATTISLVAAGEPNDTPGALTSISDYTMLPTTGTSDQLIERLNLLMCGGKMTADTRTRMKSVLDAAPIGTLQQQIDRATVAIQLVMFSPDFWVQL
jgi:hypothetical protein